MKQAVCSKCGNCDEDFVCSRYNRPIARIGACGVAASKSFHKPFTRRGVVKVIEYREGHRNPLRTTETC